MELHWDTSEVDRLAIDLSRAPGRMQRRAPKVFAVGMAKAKKNLKRMASGHSHLPQLDSHVEYDRLGDLHYELGFNKVGQGSLANIAVYGSINNAPIMGTPADALRVELPYILRHLGDEAAEAVLGGDER
jgi:hypothetical protein